MKACDFTQTSTEEGLLLYLPIYAFSLARLPSSLSSFSHQRAVERIFLSVVQPTSSFLAGLHSHQLARQVTTATNRRVKDSDFHSLHRLQSWRVFQIKQTWSWLNARDHKPSLRLQQRPRVPLHLLESIWQESDVFRDLELLPKWNIRNHGVKAFCRQWQRCRTKGGLDIYLKIQQQPSHPSPYQSTCQLVHSLHTQIHSSSSLFVLTNTTTKLPTQCRLGTDKPLRA